ncbi:MAG: M23 family metallopeptidase [Flavobacteriales bacterium]
MKKALFVVTLIFILLIAQTSCEGGGSCSPPRNEEIPEIVDTITPNMQYGFDFDQYDIHEGEVEKDWTLSHLFAKYDVTQAEINEAYNIAKDSLNLNYISKGNRYYMLCRKDNDTIHNLDYAIYVKNSVEYFVFDFSDSVMVHAKKKEVVVTVKQIGARIKQGGNLSNAINRAAGNKTISFPMVDRIAEIFSWSIDFFHLQPDDKLKIIYEEKSVDGVPVGIGNITCILFDHNKTDFYAFRYENDSISNYFNEKGQGMKSLFLSAPLKYTRMSSGYNLRRYIKLYGRIKPHLGTDYAAPYGTPIWTTADGTVSRAGYGRGNGNFVKVKHNKQYSTQYLHMSKIAAGIKVGKYVKQGEIIGYVGSTGSSSGNHVCYRFWKDGKQVDSRKQKFENAKPMDSTMLKQYLVYLDSVKPTLDRIEFPVLDTIAEEMDTMTFD